MKPLAIVAGVSLACVSASIVAQQPAQTRPQFRTNVDVVRVDVSVLDKNNQPARGLTAEDFTVFEDGKPQKVVVLTEVDLPSPEDAPTPWMRDVPFDVRSNDDLEDRRLIVILMDDGGYPEPQIDDSIRRIARGVIARLGPKDLASVVFVQGERDAADFTSDRAPLLAAVERFRPRAGMGDAMKVIGSVSAALASAPQRRKAIVLIPKQQLGVGLFDEPGRPGLTAEDIVAREDRIASSARASEVLRDAQLSMINIYPIDPRGLVAPEGLGRDGLNMSMNRQRIDSMTILADLTGGHAFANSNDFEPALTQVFRENSSYYVLGYSPENPSALGKYRRLQVKVNRPDLRVNARRGYYESRDALPTKEKPAASADPAVLALSGPLPTGDLPMQLAVAPIPQLGRANASLAVMLWLRPPRGGNRAAAREDVDVLVKAYTLDGKLQASDQVTVQAGAGIGGSTRTGSEVLSRLALKPGRYQLRVAAHGAISGLSGSVYYDVDVPDVTKLPFAISSIVLSVSPGPSVVPKTGLPDLLPVIPTAMREFLPSNRVKAFWRLTQGGKSSLVTVPLVMRVTDDHGLAVFEAKDAIEPARFTAARTSDCLFELPVGRFRPGAYLLTIEAGNSGSAAVNLRFVMK